MDFSARDAAQAVCGAAGEGRGLRTPLPRERLRTPFDNRCDGVFWERETGCIVRINMK